MMILPCVCTLYFTLLLLALIKVSDGSRAADFIDNPAEGMVLASPNGKALYLYQNSQLRPFPDFHTFTAMGFNAAEIKKMRSDLISKLPKGQALEIIAPPPEFRADDYHYHSLCEDYPRLVNDLGVVANLGDFHRLGDMFSRVRKHKKIEILALGGSITAGGYFEQFIRLLRTKEGLDVVVHNHGHGATELVYTLFCIEVERYRPDLILIDFSVNDYGHPKLMDALIRKSMSLGPHRPVVAMVNLWVAAGCPTTKYLAHGQYYNIPVLNLCPAVDLCYGKGHLPKWRWQEYSKDDGVHPWGARGVPFLGEVLYAWWKRSEGIVLDTDGPPIDVHFRSERFDSQAGARGAASAAPIDAGTASTDNSLKTIHTTRTHSDRSGLSSGFEDRRRVLQSTPTTHRSSKMRSNGESDYSGASSPTAPLPPPLYGDHIGKCTRCDALADDAEGVLQPLGKPTGFQAVTRVKIGFGGFNPNDQNSSSTKSFKKSWQAENPGDTISFKFFGSSVQVAMWQRRDGMGVMEATIDGDRERTALASGFFKGFTWAMERNNTGRSEVVPLFEGLEDKEHVITFRVTETPANSFVKGHTCQIFALLSASDSCKSKAVAP